MARFPGSVKLCWASRPARRSRACRAGPLRVPHLAGSRRRASSVPRGGTANRHIERAGGGGRERRPAAAALAVVGARRVKFNDVGPTGNESGREPTMSPWLSIPPQGRRHCSTRGATTGPPCGQAATVSPRRARRAARRVRVELGTPRAAANGPTPTDKLRYGEKPTVRKAALQGRAMGNRSRRGRRTERRRRADDRTEPAKRRAGLRRRVRGGPGLVGHDLPGPATERPSRVPGTGDQGGALLPLGAAPHARIRACRWSGRGVRS